MIARMWRGRTKAADRDRYFEYLQRTGCPDLLATTGNRGVLVFRRADSEIAEFLLVSVWESFDAIRRFAGPDARVARYYPEDASFLLEMDPHVTHFELLTKLPQVGCASSGARDPGLQSVQTSAETDKKDTAGDGGGSDHAPRATSRTALRTTL